jgi:hypothetical protein
MKERPMEFPEITTSDIGCALYLLANRCRLIRLTYVEGRGVRTRFRMTFTGMNARLYDAHYFTSLDQEVDYEKLPDLFARLTKLLPDMTVITQLKPDPPPPESGDLPGGEVPAEVL